MEELSWLDSAYQCIAQNGPPEGGPTYAEARTALVGGRLQAAHYSAAAASARPTRFCMGRLVVGTVGLLRARTPIVGGVVPIVEAGLIGIDDGEHVHTF